MKKQLKTLIIGNWKMNCLKKSLIEIDFLNKKIINNPQIKCEIIICPSTTILDLAIKRAEKFKIGAQDCHSESNGAHTGDISAKMLTDIGVSAVILGHSERRLNHNETSTQITKKIITAQLEGLLVIACVGETKEEHESGKVIEIISHQILNSIPLNSSNANNIVIAYEPIWAIGTGNIPNISDITKVHNNIRNLLKNIFKYDGNKIRILYGGSVNSLNAKKILSIPNVNGVLVGNASLKADDFFAIIKQS